MPPAPAPTPQQFIIIDGCRGRRLIMGIFRNFRGILEF